MLNSSYFVSKSEILRWLNEFFNAGYSKIEQCASGAIHCQIIDAIFPGVVELHKVNFNAKYDYQYVDNYKVLQKAFNACEIDKPIPIERLTKAKYQDNLEFIQWMKNLFDNHYDESKGYDAIAEKQAAVERYATEHKYSGAIRSSNYGGVRKPLVKSSGYGRPTLPRPPRPVVKSATRTPVARVPVTTRPAPRVVASRAPTVVRTPSVTTTSPAQTEKIKQLEDKIAKMKLAIFGLEKERNFYFRKLRDVEKICQEAEDTEIESFKEKVVQILYATEDEGQEQQEQEQQEEEEIQQEPEPEPEELEQQDSDLVAYDGDGDERDYFMEESH